MDDRQYRPVIPGIAVSETGEAVVDAALTEELISIAIRIDDISPHPVDVEHVLAAIILAADNGSIVPESTRLTADDDHLIGVLTEQVNTVFSRFGGKLGRED